MKPLRKWRVSASLAGGFHVGEVEADTKEQAEDLAEELVDNQGAPTLCHHCSDRIDELDLGGEVYVHEEASLPENG